MQFKRSQSCNASTWLLPPNFMSNLDPTIIWATKFLIHVDVGIRNALGNFRSGTKSIQLHANSFYYKMSRHPTRQIKFQSFVAKLPITHRTVNISLQLPFFPSFQMKNRNRVDMGSPWVEFKWTQFINYQRDGKAVSSKRHQISRSTSHRM